LVNKTLNNHRCLEDYKLSSHSLHLERKQVDCLLQLKAYLVRPPGNNRSKRKLLFSEALELPRFSDSPQLKIPNRKVVFLLLAHYFLAWINKVSHKQLSLDYLAKLLLVVLTHNRKINQHFLLNNSQIFFKTNLPRLKVYSIKLKSNNNNNNNSRSNQQTKITKAAYQDSIK